VAVTAGEVLVEVTDDGGAGHPAPRTAGAGDDADDLGADGLIHHEASPALTCACGYTAASPDILDAHFLDAFTPASGIGPDGKRHAAEFVAAPR
jgi:hypothetical protein